MNVVLVYRGRYHVREALDLETLSAVLRRAGHRTCLVYDPDTLGVTDNVFQVPFLSRWLNLRQQPLRRILRREPEAVVFSVLATNYAWCRELAAAIKQQSSAAVIFLGLHTSLVPERIMRDGCVDYAVVGEPEGVLDPLLRRIADQRDVADVGNVWYRCEGQPRHTFRAPLVDLDALPLPDKELFAPYVSHRYSYSAMVSRGCPYQCSFCEETCAKKLYGPRYFRRKSVTAVMDELLAGKRQYGFREVIFKDSYLSGDKRWLREFMERYRREIGVPFKCFCTICGFDDETARLLKEGGCYCVEFGLQTWNDRLRRDILRRQETSADAFRVFGICDQHRLRYDVDHMFCLPTETEQDHRQGAECYRQLRYLGRVKVHHLVYYPTSDILAHGLAAGDVAPTVVEELAEGCQRDFYAGAAAGEPARQIVAAYAALYKILPLLPARVLDWSLQRRRVAWCRWIPFPVMAALQATNAVRCGDLRFAAYLSLYPAKVWHTLRGSDTSQK